MDLSFHIIFENMKKVLLFPILLFCLQANAQLFNPNPEDKFSKNNFYFSIIGQPNGSLYIGNNNRDSVYRSGGADIGGAIAYFPVDRFSITFSVTYRFVNTTLSRKLIIKEQALIINPYFSYFPLKSKKISVDIGWFYTDYIEKKITIPFTDREKLHGINYGFTFHHVFRKNLGFLNDHLGFCVYFHRILTLKRVQNVKNPFLLNLKLGLIYHL